MLVGKYANPLEVSDGCNCLPNGQEVSDEMSLENIFHLPAKLGLLCSNMLKELDISDSYSRYFVIGNMLCADLRVSFVNNVNAKFEFVTQVVAGNERSCDIVKILIEMYRKHFPVLAHY